MLPNDRAAHDWYRFVLSFPPHLVRDYVSRFHLNGSAVALDPFCGTGTTLVECKKLGVPSLGIEAHPMAFLATRVKTNWVVDAGKLLRQAQHIAQKALAVLSAEGIDDDVLPLGSRAAPPRHLRALHPEQSALLLNRSISGLPLHKTLTLLKVIAETPDRGFHDCYRLAMAKALVGPVGNLHFGPEVGVTTPKEDAPVVASWLCNVEAMASDLRTLSECSATKVEAIHGDSRDVLGLLPDRSVDAVITSPPYPNEKDYTRTTRLETILLGLVKTKDELRHLKKSLVRSNTRSVYKEDRDDAWIQGHEQIEQIAQSIERRRVELGKTSGFERMYPRVTRLYFGGMARHLANLRRVLRPGAQLAYVVGDQASYLQVMIRTGQILGKIAVSLGYELVGIDLFRTRPATATRQLLREEVVLLRWDGKNGFSSAPAPRPAGPAAACGRSATGARRRRQ